MLSDVAGFMIAFAAIKYSKNPSTFENSYGFHRIEVLGALAGVFLIWGLLIGVNIFAIYTIINKSYFIGSQYKAYLFLGTACFGFGCNVVNLLALNCFCNPEEEEEDENASSTVSSIKGYSTNKYSMN